MDSARTRELGEGVLQSPGLARFRCSAASSPSAKARASAQRVPGNERGTYRRAMPQPRLERGQGLWAHAIGGDKTAPQTVMTENPACSKPLEPIP